MSDVMLRVELKDDCVVKSNEGAAVTFSNNVSFSERRHKLKWGASPKKLAIYELFCLPLTYDKAVGLGNYQQFSINQIVFFLIKDK